MTRIGVIMGKALSNPGLMRKKLSRVRPSEVFKTTEEVFEKFYGKAANNEFSSDLAILKNALIVDKFPKEIMDCFIKGLSEPEICMKYKKPLTKKSTLGQYAKRLMDYAKAEIEHNKAVKEAFEKASKGIL